MSRWPLRGLFAPVTTPFGGDGAPDEAGWRQNGRALVAAGLDGLVVAGSTGEAALLDETERHRLVEWARPLVPPERWLIVGCGAESTRLAVRRCREAAARGADAVLVVAPHYYGDAMTDGALHAHYEQVADESPVPVVLYNIPKYMHFALPADLVAELAVHDNVIGIKDSSGDLAMLGGFLAAQSETFTVLTGNAQIFHASLQAGARGGILAVSLFAPALTLRIRDGWRAGDDADAAAAQAALTTPGREIVGVLGVPGVKAAMELVGVQGGPVRLPLLPLGDAERARVAALLDEAGVARAAGGR